jgi:hypothetical protein
MNNKTNKLPFIIHACSHSVDAFPTHTHGLSELGLPEFIIDPLAFGPKGNAYLIDNSYCYLTHPKRSELIPSILSGETLEVQLHRLNPLFYEKSEYCICFREVPHEFEAVMQAYKGFEWDEFSAMNFIQIYVEGDDFALDDKYYEGGVSW